MFSTLAMLALGMGAAVWTESSLANIYPATPPEPFHDVHIEAARGEWESIQIAVRANNELTSVAVDATGLGEDIPAPAVYLVDYVVVPPSPTRFGRLRVPDRLIPYAPFAVPENTTKALWLTYTVPVTAEAGRYEGEIVVRAGDDETRIPVSCEVFGFSVPPVESLRSLIPLNRTNIARTLAVQGNELDDWTPVYDALAPYQLSFSIWDDVNALPKTGDGALDVATIQAHLEYLIRQANMAAIDVGFARAGLAPVASRDEAQRFIPPEHVYLYDMGHWLRRLDAASRAVVMAAAPSSRESWQPAREASFLVYQVDAQIKRILSTPLHPFFERYVDIWALPLQDLRPLPVDRLRAGQSLQSFRPAGAAIVLASGSANAIGHDYATQPADAFDGSFFSHWVAAPGPGERFPWLQIEFETQVSSEEIRIGWIAGHEAQNVRVRTSYDGRTFSTASFLWETEPPNEETGLSWSIGRFSASKKFATIRLEFRDPPPDVAIAVADMLITPGVEEEPAPIAPIQPWLQIVSQTFPSLALPADPAEPRLLPWVCWAHKALGFLHDGVAEWPDAWQGVEFPSGWRTDTVLVYPSASGILPSIRLMRLRDGLEDYDYFRTLEQMRYVFGARDQNIAKLRSHPLYSPDISYGEITKLRDALLDRRSEIAHAMNDLLRTEAK